jgi:hypothetical protein
MKLVTMGVYGFSEAAFFNALHQAGVDTFCDIRWRRGVRGSEYAFANRARLEKRLAELGIRYLHFRELAPTPALIQRQTGADKVEGSAKRQHVLLTPWPGVAEGSALHNELVLLPNAARRGGGSAEVVVNDVFGVSG